MEIDAREITRERLVSSAGSGSLPQLKRREINPDLEARALTCGLNPVLARVIARRALSAEVDLQGFLSASLSDLDAEYLLADVGVAAQRLAAAIITRERIAIQTDYDMDGLGAHAVFKTALIEGFLHPADRLCSFVGHRLTEGYGLTDLLVDRILAGELPSLLVTADNGSSDEARIRRLAAAGVDVIVTDHHHYMVDSPPASAYAFVNPQRADCHYPDKAIAGGMVLWLLLRATQRVLVEAGYLCEDNYDLAKGLDYVACSTVADCVSLASVNNRAIVRAGLHAMNSGHRYAWEQMSRLLKCEQFTADTIAFGVAPHVNARSRLADPLAALHLLLAKDFASARRCAELLHSENEARKLIEREMIRTMTDAAASCVMTGRLSICLLLPDGHPGVQGICSSRLVELYGRPTFLFSPSHTDPEVLTGSARTIDKLHVHEALRVVDGAVPGLIVKFGGHKAAAGASVRRGDFERFAELFERAVRLQLSDDDVGPVRWSDGDLCAEEMSLETAVALQALEPTGRGFERPVFDGMFNVLAVKPVGDHTHLKLQLEYQDRQFTAIWFRARPSAAHPAPVKKGERARFLYSLMDNQYRGQHALELKVESRCV